MSRFERREVKFELPSRTKQEFKDEADVNKIMQRFKKVMGVDFLKRFYGYSGGTFGDFSNVTDYRSALEQVQQAQEVFMKLPAVVRSRFGNDVAGFLDFCQDPKNQAELVSLGLANPSKVDTQKPVLESAKTA